MKTKKILCAFLTAFLCVTAVSCGDTEETSTENSDSSVSEIETEADTQQAEIPDETEQETTEETQPEEETQSKTEQEVTEETQPKEETKSNTGNVSAYGTTADISEYITATTINPPLWKVTDPETQNELYIMGTIHVLPSDFDGFPDYIRDIYENSDGIAVE